MNRKTQYQTKQTTQICTYLEQTQGNHVTVNDISAYFKAQGITMGTTTIYRHLERLVAEGTVAKYIIDGTSSACFEYLGEHDSRESQPCFHCKCEKCGKLIHLHCEELMNIGQHMANEHGFKINVFRTVFYGLCESCSKEEK